jgi:hypothetical protein
MNTPTAEEYAPYFQPYIDKVEAVDSVGILDALETQHEETQAFLRAIPEAKGDHRYADGKWSIKELVQHLIDSERVFCYRAMRFSRNDSTDLPGFDHDAYVSASSAARHTMEDLADEFEVVRLGTLALFHSFDDEMWGKVGTANGTAMSVRAAAFVSLGHELHHLAVIKERYL